MHRSSCIYIGKWISTTNKGRFDHSTNRKRQEYIYLTRKYSNLYIIIIIIIINYI